MKIVILFMALLAACQETTLVQNDSCMTEATVKKLELDGCGFVFQLTDGSYLIPERRVYIQAPQKTEDPIYYYSFVEGAKVKINYQPSSAMSACMAGPVVFVTCITDIQTPEQ